MEDRTINASPTKDFFIYMITRDIDLKDAILELVDNCVDGALRIRKDNNFNGLWIKLNISQEEFSISDNCGGISVINAKEFAFRFGRNENSDNFVEFSTGRFGIGMKRALFKIGRFFSIKSTTQNSYFIVNINVDDWAKDENWNLYFNEVNESVQYNLESCGTIIAIRNLYESIANNFKLEIFKGMLKQHIQQHISASIEKGLAISINGIPLEFNKNEIFMNNQFIPANEFYTIGDGDNEVEIQIIAGIGETGKPSNAGWYIYCNGRLVLSADKTKTTGWGEEDGPPEFHPTWARFRGFVFFDSKNSNNLPWNTTKTGVDFSSPVFINAKVRMKILFKSVAEFIRNIKSEEGEDRKEIEDIIDNLPKRQITIGKRITDFPQSTQIISEGLEFPKNTNPNITISYKKPKSEIEKIKKLLKVTSNKQVGEKTFDYYLDMEGDE